MKTITSKQIIKELEDTGIKLTIEQKKIIINRVYEALVLSYSERKNTNECDCGQPSCSICN